jgi:arylsulfatase A-like enzyme
VEAIDLVPTFLDALGLPGAPGVSLQPLLQGQAQTPARDAVFSENSYAFRDVVRLPVHRPVDGCQMTMVRTKRWKYIHYEGLRPQLFDLQSDLDEFDDLGTDPAHASVREEMAERMFTWLRQRKRFSTISHENIERWNRREVETGIQIGVW